ncbi:DedA family protein [Candidatus Micrarchaeota archaeon]|nr:DedA family protein [Candidatus Micrarchaeota archaeon]
MVDYVAITLTLIHSYGLTGLFFLSFLSASLLPFPPEPFIIAGLAFFNPWLVFAVVTVGALVSACVNYYAGLKGLNWFLVKRSADGEFKAEEWFKKWGPHALVISPWIPFIGDLFPIVAGALKMRFKVFLALAIVGRVIKTAVVVLVGMGLLSFLKPLA